MPYTPTYTGATPTVDADEDTWGQELNNDALGPIADDLAGIAGVANAAETTAGLALPRSGGTMTNVLALGDPSPNQASDAGFRGLPTTSIDADRTFVAKDAGKCIRLTGTTARTWTIPPGVLQVGQVVVIRNASTAALAIARGSGVELRIPGSATNANRSVISQGFVSLWQEDTNVWLVSGTGVA